MINLPFAGHTNPTLPLTEELVRRGHSVTYINSPVYKEKIEATGAKFVPFLDYPEDLSEEQVKRQCFRAAFQTAMAQKEKFDLLIYEMFFYPGKVIADRWNIPCVRQFSQPAWTPEMVQNARISWKIFCRLIDMQVMGKKNVIAMGMEGKNLIDATLYDRPALNIVYVPALFQANRDFFDERFIFTCPPMRALGTSNLRIPYHAMKQPIIYISMGSIISSKAFYKRCIKAFGDKGVSVILNTGKVDPRSLGHVPQNIYPYAFVPQLEVLQHSDLFITHCGMNSVNEAMSFGVPMLAMPIINDQIANAQRILELGIGLKMRAFPSTANQLYQRAMEVLESNEIKQRSIAVKETIAAERKFSEVVTKVEQCIQ